MKNGPLLRFCYDRRRRCLRYFCCGHKLGYRCRGRCFHCFCCSNKLGNCRCGNRFRHRSSCTSFELGSSHARTYCYVHLPIRPSEVFRPGRQLSTDCGPMRQGGLPDRRYWSRPLG